MKILALDAATEACSAALYDDGETSERFELAPREHAHLLLPMAQALLADAGWRLADLDAFAFGRGPGAFTGLRIAAGLVQGLALGAGLPVLRISNLATLAARTMARHGAQKVLVVNDARMDELYCGAYERAAAPDGQGSGAGVSLRALSPEQVLPPAALAAEAYDANWRAAGNGWAAQEQGLAKLRLRLAPGVAEIHPHAEDIARLAALAYARGEAVAAHEALPEYVRDDVARKPARR